MKSFTTKSVEKLLRSLNSDPRLQALDDATILSEEQYPMAFDALITRIKDPIALTTTVETLNYNDTSTVAQSIPSSMRTQLKEKQLKLKDLLQLNPTVDNPMDEITYSHWIHRVTNICLDAAQMALQDVDTSPGMHYLFAPSSISDNTVRRGEKRNVEGQLLYHTILLKSPWELTADYNGDILDLMSEKDPYLFTRSQPHPDQWRNYDEWGEEYISTDRQKALQTIQTTKNSIVVLLKRIHKFTSHTFHVLIRELIPGAKADKSNLFTMIKEHRNQYMIRARAADNTEPYTAKNTLDFIEAKFVKTNANTAHIAWTNILLHTRIIGQAIYQWQASFDPLIRKFEQARSKKMRKSQTKDVKQLMAKQITDSEKIILSGISAKYSIDKIDKGTFVLKEFQDDLALNTARFKGYTPDARIVAHLRTRAKEFTADLPSFLNKKPQDTDQPGKRKFKRFQHYMTNDEAEDADVPDEDQWQLYTSKGRVKGLGKGKGKGKKGKGKFGNRSHQPRPTLSFDGFKGKGKGKFPSQNHYKGKGKNFAKGNRSKGKPIAPADATTPAPISSHTSIVCGFCHIIGHTTENCRKRLALHNNTLYQQTRSKFSSRQQLLFAGLENSVFSANTCSWCLQTQCNRIDCSPPEEPLFFTQTNNAFCEEILPLVKNAKLELPVGSSDPLNPQHFHFQESYWGEDDYSYPYAHQYTNNEYDSYIYDVNNNYEYDQYHYPPQNYDEGWENYNYEEESHLAGYTPPDKNQSDEPDDDYNTREGLLCEEDAEVSFFGDDLKQ